MSYVLTDAAPAGKSFTVNALLARAGHVLERQSTNDADRAALLTSIGVQYDSQDEDNAALKYLNEAYRISRQVPDASVRARAACALASALAKADNSARPESLFQEGLKQLPQGAEFALDRSFCWASGTWISMDRGDEQFSIERARAALIALDQVPFNHEIASLRAEAWLAEAYRVAGRYHEAAAAFERLWPRLVAQGRDDTATAGTWLNNWGMAVAQMGRPLEAEKLLRRSMDIHRADASDSALSPMLLTNYAQQLLDIGRLQEANDYASRALESAKAAGDEVVINQTLLRLARIRRAQHDYAGSLASLDEVEPRLQRALPPGHSAFGALASERSQTLEMQGETGQAMVLANLAIHICEESIRQGKGCAQFLPSLLRHRASVEIALKKFGAAEADASEALKLLLREARPGEASESTGLAYLTLARCFLGEGRDQEGRAMAQRAAAQLVPAVGTDSPDARDAQRLAAGGEPVSGA